jgi:hypothetical protein
MDRAPLAELCRPLTGVMARPLLTLPRNSEGLGGVFPRNHLPHVISQLAVMKAEAQV